MDGVSKTHGRNTLNKTDVPALEEPLLELFNTFQVFLLISLVAPNSLISLGYPALQRPLSGAYLQPILPCAKFFLSGGLDLFMLGFYNLSQLTVLCVICGGQPDGAGVSPPGGWT